MEAKLDEQVTWTLTLTFNCDEITQFGRALDTLLSDYADSTYGQSLDYAIVKRVRLECPD